MISGSAKCFTDLDFKIKNSAASRTNASGINLRMRYSSAGTYYVKQLSTAASKHRLARSAKILLEGYGVKSLREYQAQFQLTLAAIALESYAEMFRKKWYDVATGLVPFVNQVEFDQLRSIIPAAVVEKARDQLTQPIHKGRLDSFIAGNDHEILSIVMAIRHCFAHGLIGSQLACAQFGQPLATLTLDLIERHCENVAATI